jgi:hypothetical protein
MMNSLLDTFADRIYEGSDVFERLCTLRYAKSVADEVRKGMLDSEAALLMPAVERALTALERVQEGFQSSARPFRLCPGPGRPDLLYFSSNVESLLAACKWPLRALW